MNPNAPAPDSSPAPRNTRGRRLGWTRSLSLLLGLVAFCWIALSLLLATYLTSRRTPLLAEEQPRLLTATTFKNLRLTTSDNLDLGAWYFPGQAGQPVILLLHGQFASRSSCEHQIQWLLERGYAVMIPSLRAHGDSQGSRSDFGYSARHDVIACVDWLKTHQPDQNIVIWGQSLGAAAATFAAEKLQHAPCAYILECPYQDLETAVWNRCQMLVPGGLDALLYHSLRTSACFILPHFDDISPLKAIVHTPATVPILILAGAADIHARPEEAQSLQAAINGQAKLEIFDEATHMGLDLQDKQAYQTLICEFIDNAVSPRETSR